MKRVIAFTQMRYTIFGLFVLIVLAAVGMAIIGVLQPQMTDDFTMHMGIVRNSSPFNYAWGTYHGWSGRLSTVVLHWCAMHGGWTYIVFGALNGAWLAGITWLMMMIGYGRRLMFCRGDVAVFALVFAAVWFCSPAIGEVAFWRTGADAYIWSLGLGLVFFLPYRLWADARRRLAMILPMLIAGIIIGLHGEQITASLMFAVPITMRLQRRWPWWGVAGWVGTMVGGVISVLGPGNYKRLHFGTVAGPADMVASIFPYGARLCVTLWPVLVIWAILTLALWYCRYPRPLPWTTMLIGVAGMLGAAGVMILLPFHQSDRSRFIPFAWALIALITTLDIRMVLITWQLFQRSLLAAAAVALFAMVYSVAMAIPRTIDLSKQVAQRDRLIRQACLNGVMEISIPLYDVPNARVPYIDDITSDSLNWRNANIAHYYGVKKITANQY